jgi:hypothetical protein
MALALNIFKTVTTLAPTSPVGIYTAPVGYTGVVLLAQATNVDTESHDISFYHVRKISVGPVGFAVTTEILEQYPIPSFDSLGLTTGKLILEPGDSLKVSADDGSSIKIILSILETLN